MSSDELSIYREGPMNVERDESHIADVGLRDTPDRPRSKGCRLTLSFIAVAVVFIAIAAIVVNRVVGNLAEDNLIRIAEENTALNGVHMEAMMRRSHQMQSMSASGINDQLRPVTLDYLTGPQGLPVIFPVIVEGIPLVKMNVFDLNGTTVWSTDLKTIGITKRESPLFATAVVGMPSSKLVKDHDVVHLDGVVRSIDVVETYLPLREVRGGGIIGVMEIYRDVTDDVAVQVDDSKSAILWTTVATMGGLFLALLGFIVVADLAIGRSRRREQQVATELAIEVQERAGANEELQHTATALQAANKELETFSYSVSHDLRAPLRSLDGFSQILLEDFGSQLDEVGNGYLERIRANSQRMSQLIDDLLELSRVSRGQIQHEQVDLSTLVESICNDLRETQPDRDVTFIDAKGLTATGDPALLRAAMGNLLGNAWKYTGKRQHATIEIGSARENGREVYFVKDDGAGFDMEYADKLFLPFHRLHSESEFDGTGIGLATVQRIISRHGGSIWAESKPDHGATFYFTLS